MLNCTINFLINNLLCSIFSLFRLCGLGVVSWIANFAHVNRIGELDISMFLNVLKKRPCNGRLVLELLEWWPLAISREEQNLRQV